jgi:hypothetical protein
MNSIPIRLASLAALLLAGPGLAGAQTFDAAGTRAAGMSGAFVAVADDASAAYWNPAGFASGSFFSLVMDRTSGTADPGAQTRAGSRSAWMLALGAPAVGLSYYRLRATLVEPGSATAGAGESRNSAGTDEVLATTLVSHHVGATLVQSLVPGLAVGATVKVVRGIAGAEVRPAAGRDALLADGGALMSRGSNRFDADLGVKATYGIFRAGVTVRNLTEPEFDTRNAGERLRLERQARAGVALVPLEGWIVAADLDLLKTAGTRGDGARDIAIGTEGRIAKRAFVRAGTRFDTVGDGRGRSATISVGGSYAVYGSFLLDAQLTGGSDQAATGWGISARFTY